MLPKNIYDISKMFIFHIMLKSGFNPRYNSPVYRINHIQK